MKVRKLTRSTRSTNLNLARPSQPSLGQLLDAEVGRRNEERHRRRVVLGKEKVDIHPSVLVSANRKEEEEVKLTLIRRR